MRAAWYEAFGPARDVLEVGEMRTPSAGPGEVRVRLHASGINSYDVKVRSRHGDGFLGDHAAAQKARGHNFRDPIRRVSLEIGGMRLHSISPRPVNSFVISPWDFLFHA